MGCGQSIPGETIKEPSRRHFLPSHPPLTLTIYRHPRNLLTPSQNVCHQIQKKKNGLGPETRWQSITNVLYAPIKFSFVCSALVCLAFQRATSRFSPSLLCPTIASHSVYSPSSSEPMCSPLQDPILSPLPLSLLCSLNRRQRAPPPGKL